MTTETPPRGSLAWLASPDAATIETDELISVLRSLAAVTLAAASQSGLSDSEVAALEVHQAPPTPLPTVPRPRQ